MMSEISLSPMTADALDALSIIERVGTINVNLAEMAWLWFVLRELEDSDSRFPRGKWATIQHIQDQLERAARDVAEGMEE